MSRRLRADGVGARDRLSAMNALAQPAVSASHELELLTHVVMQDGATIAVTLTKVSSKGCSIRADYQFEPGQLVSLSLLKYGSIDALVHSASTGGAELVFDVNPSLIRGPSPRQADRVAVSGEVSVRRRLLNAFKVEIFDLSPEGCRVGYVDRPQVGERVSISFPGLQPIHAQVRWIRPESIGLSFLNPLHPAIFDTLVAKLR